ncbi:aquaporin [Ascoidea rubescens DSM 1968]|uniref:Aquaporin n=1 Tax=Ascoidea rubescens DSM 1968 TaxID=1344418 RepID=A0A1D2V8P6_9ASCO|nr:aquaporin [Ascoidea rubescens DSM 1968]ODV57988.1 aquaporin [Ascoidea rubescens DSM 1968]
MVIGIQSRRIIKVDLENPGKKTHRNTIYKIKECLKPELGEFLGTMVLVTFGDGVVAQVRLSNQNAGNYTSIALGWASAVMLGFVASGGDPGHLNPGVTISAAIFRRFRWKRVPSVILAQLLGGFIGSCVVYATYVGSINQFEGGPDIRSIFGEKETASIFCTFPQSYLTWSQKFISELIPSILLQIGIFSLSDFHGHTSPSNTCLPIGLFILILAIGSSFGFQTGYAINMARDFAPRVAASFLGYGVTMFTAYDHYFWIPIVAPIIGCIIGSIIYDTLIYTGDDSRINQKVFGVTKKMKISSTYF